MIYQCDVSISLFISVCLAHSLCPFERHPVDGILAWLSALPPLYPVIVCLVLTAKRRTCFSPDTFVTELQQNRNMVLNHHVGYKVFKTKHTRRQVVRDRERNTDFVRLFEKK